MFWYEGIDRRTYKDFGAIMRILQVHKYLYPKAGAERYFLDVSRLLFKKGHTVGMWGTNEKFQYPVVEELKGFEIYKDLLVDEIHFDKREGFLKDAAKAAHFMWSREAARKFRRVLQRFQPDIIHIHNIYHHLTPSILAVARRAGIPVVMTVHDWSLVNPNYSLFDHGEVCERQGLSAILHRCIQNSLVASALSVVAFAVQKIMRTEKRAIKAYLVPVPFALKQLKHAKIPASKIHIIPYPVPVESERGPHREPTEPFVLYAGRLSAEKGVSTLIAAAAHLPGMRFVIAGAGPESEALRAECVIKSITNVEFTGFIPREMLATYIKSARLILVPSLWYDVSPYAVLEAQAAGKAVLASNIGGIPDLIDDGKTGFLFAPGNARILANRIESLVAHPRMLDDVGRRAEERIKNRHEAEAHYQALMNIYEKIALV